MTKTIAAGILVAGLGLSAAGAGEVLWKWDGADLSVWEVKQKDEGGNQWKVGKAALSAENEKALVANDGGKALVNVVSGHGQSWDTYSKAKWGGDFRIEVDVMVPKGANSGVYVMGEYEVQVLDSYGKDKMGPGDMGAIYGASPAAVNACKKPGEWQKYVIDFRAPKFDADGKKVANARFLKVVLNGKTLHEEVEMKGPTPSGVTGKEAAEGPVMFQGDHGPVAYRNLVVTRLGE